MTKFSTQEVSDGERITEVANYEGVRIKLRGALGNAKITMQLDIGFGDVIIPAPASLKYLTILDLPAPKLQGYSKESYISEKFEAMVKLGILNSRMKDFFDIWLLLRQFDFKGSRLATAIAKTFSTRGTNFSSRTSCLNELFYRRHSKSRPVARIHPKDPANQCSRRLRGSDKSHWHFSETDC